MKQNKNKKEGLSMTMKTTFNQAKEKNLERLGQYVPVVARVHGGSHPEFLDVKKVYDRIVRLIQEAGAETPELTEEFASLRKITDNYTVPGDVCESYEAVYKMLEEVDRAYHA